MPLWRRLPIVIPLTALALMLGLSSVWNAAARPDVPEFTLPPVPENGPRQNPTLDDYGLIASRNLFDLHGRGADLEPEDVPLSPTSIELGVRLVATLAGGRSESSVAIVELAGATHLVAEGDMLPGRDLSVATIGPGRLVLVQGDQRTTLGFPDGAAGASVTRVAGAASRFGPSLEEWNRAAEERMRRRAANPEWAQVERQRTPSARPATINRHLERARRDRANAR